MIEVIRRDNESSDALTKRFKNRVKASGVLYRKRKNRFRTKKKSKLEARKDAVRRAKVSKEMELLKRLGKIDSRGHW